jgi:tRNA (uracil-5-)-methyltransferase
LNEGLTKQRAIAKATTYKRGATLLLREALDTSESSVSLEKLQKKCVTDSKEIIDEQVGNFRFNFPAGRPFPEMTRNSDTEVLFSKTTIRSWTISRPTSTIKSSPLQNE